MKFVFVGNGRILELTQQVYNATITIMIKLKLTLVCILQISGVSMLLNAQSKYVLKGEIESEKIEIEKVFLDISVNGKAFTDSAEVRNGKYSFRGNIAEPVLADLRASYRSKPTQEVIPVFIESGSISLSHQGAFSQCTVKGSASHRDFLPVLKLQDSIRLATSSLHSVYNNLLEKGDSAGMHAVLNQKKELDKQFRQTYKAGFIANPFSPIAPYLLEQYSENAWKDDVVEFDSLLSLLPLRSLRLPTGERLLKRQEKLSSTRIGSIAPDFIQFDTLGRPVSLSSFRGNYVLLDFWASWCTPCRSENPNYVKVYSRFREQGFIIVGVSLDDNSEAWKAAIKTDGLTWTNVSDLKGQENKAFVLFRGYDIPTNILIDPFGKIIAKDLFGDDLMGKLTAILR